MEDGEIELDKWKKTICGRIKSLVNERREAGYRLEHYYSILHHILKCPDSLSALARLSATLVALLGDRGDVGDMHSPCLGDSRVRPFRAAEMDRFDPRTRRLKPRVTQVEQQPAAKLPKQRRALSSIPAVGKG